MQYIASFLEGIITFISPCLLPMLPIYATYFAGGGERNTKKTLKNAIGFVLGFTLVFVAMGALAGTVGGFLSRYQAAVNIVSGIIVIFFGLNYLGVFKLNIFKGQGAMLKNKELGFFSSLFFGMAFSVGWTPCVGPVLGSVLALASQEGQAVEGMLLLLIYSVGLGIPFVLSAVLIDQLKSAFSFIKKHYKVINIISGCFLIIVGILMATGTVGRMITLFS